MAVDFFAGCLGGCASVLVGHPFDTVKVHLQTQSSATNSSSIKCFRNLVAKNGAFSLYRGITSPLMSVAGINAIIFGVYGNAQRVSSSPESLRTHFLAGCAAGLAQSPLCSPMELVKTQLQITNSKTPISALECLKQIYKQNGFKGVFRGLNLTIMREVPGFGTYFVTYEMLTRSESSKPISTAYMLLAGGLAGSASWIISYPMDVIKSRVQADGMDGKWKYTGAVDCLRKSVAAEGVGVLSKGLTLAIIRAFPTNAACFTVVTWTIRLCQSQNEAEEKQNQIPPHHHHHEHHEKRTVWFGNNENLLICDVNRQSASPVLC